MRCSNGIRHSVAIKEDGSLWAWGCNDDHQLGIKKEEFPPIPENRLTPNRVGAHNNWVSVEAGAYCTIGIKSDGSLWGWGDPSYLLFPPDPRYPGPKRIDKDYDWASFSLGESYAMAIKKDGSLWAWGGVYYSYERKVQINKDKDWASVSAGSDHSVFLKTDGSLWVLPHSTFDWIVELNEYAPAQVGNDNDWVAITAGYSRTMAIKKDGSLWSWGNNENRTPVAGYRALIVDDPEQIGTDKDWASVSLSSAEAVAIKNDGSLWAWGHNKEGQLGDGTTLTRSSPVRIGSNSNWVSASMTLGGAMHPVKQTAVRADK